MPRIHDQFQECSIYLYPTKEAAEAGRRTGGSGCLVSINAPVEGWSHIYAVTNSHVIKGGCPVIRLNTTDGSKAVLEYKQEDWFHHPDGHDLAVCPLDLEASKYQIRFIDRDKQFITHDRLRYFDIGPGDGTFMVGRFISHEGEQRNLPSLRFGNIAMMPNEPLVDSRGQKKESFLVESRSSSGYSGSPVFVHIPNYETRFEGHPRGVVLLLGINWGHPELYDEILEADGTVNRLGWQVKTNTGMAAVVPAWHLSDLLNTPELVAQREKEDKELL